jgi:hypothetical protein
MSNTFKTKPFWVQLANGYHRSVPVHAVEGAHDCDLPDKPGREQTHCHWTFIYTGTRICSCWLCHGSAFEGSPKRERQRGNDEIRDQAAERPASPRLVR